MIKLIMSLSVHDEQFKINVGRNTSFIITSPNKDHSVLNPIVTKIIRKELTVIIKEINKEYKELENK